RARLRAQARRKLQLSERGPIAAPDATDRAEPRTEAQAERLQPAVVLGHVDRLLTTRSRRGETALVRRLRGRARTRRARRDVQPPAAIAPGEDADPGAVAVRLDDGLDLARSPVGHDHRLVDDQ